jgi:hypothetical protein
MDLVHLNLLEARSVKRAVFGVEMGGFEHKNGCFGPENRGKSGTLFTDRYMVFISIAFMSLCLDGF